MGDELLPPVPDFQLHMPQLGESLFPQPPWNQPLVDGLRLHLDLPPILDLDAATEQVLRMLDSTNPPDWALPSALPLLGLPIPAAGLPAPPTPSPTPRANPWSKPPQPNGMPWTDPPRPATVGDLTKAILKVPAVDDALKGLEKQGQSLLNRNFQLMKQHPESLLLEVPCVVAAGYAAYLVGTKFDPVAQASTGSLPGFSSSVSLGLPGLKLKWTYEDTVQHALTDPGHPKKWSAGVELDVNELLRSIK